MDLIEEDRPPSVAPSVDELAEFKAQVAEWVKIDDQVKKLRVAVRERLVHQKALGSRIQTFMKQFNYDNLNTQQGRIKNNVREVKTPLTVTDVRKKLYIMITEDSKFDEDTIKKIHEVFEGDRPKVIKEGLRREVPKVSLSIDL